MKLLNNPLPTRPATYALAALMFASAMAVPGAASAGGKGGKDRHSYRDYGRVVDVQPIERWREVPYERRVCNKRGRHHDHHQRSRHDNKRHDGNDNLLPAVLGGVVGGVIGNQIGDGHGRIIATAAGGAVGAAVGWQLAEVGHDGRDGHRNRDGHRHGKRHCRTVTEYRRERTVVGYRVKYRYKGEKYSTRTDSHPGRRIPLRVSIRPDF